MARTTCHGKGQKGGDEDNKGERDKDVGQHAGPARFVGAGGRGDIYSSGSSNRVELRERLAEDDTAVID